MTRIIFKGFLARRCRTRPAHRPRERREGGFTLTELLVAMVLAGVAMSAIYAAYVTQQRAYKTTTDVTDVQQNLRSAMYFIEKDLRMAGYDPLDSGEFGFTYAGENGFKFTWDENENGGDPEGGEYISYKFETPETTLERDNGDGSFNDVASNISDVTFDYFTSSGVTTTTPALVRVVRVTITGERGGHARTLQSRIWCRNSGL